jgi:hypothetical protein
MLFPEHVLSPVSTIPLAAPQENTRLFPALAERLALKGESGQYLHSGNAERVDRGKPAGSIRCGGNAYTQRR